MKIIIIVIKYKININELKLWYKNFYTKSKIIS